MTQYEKLSPYMRRMKESDDRKRTIIKMAKKPGVSHQKIAEQVRCSRAYVTQVLAAAAKEKQS